MLFLIRQVLLVRFKKRTSRNVSDSTFISALNYYLIKKKFLLYLYEAILLYLQILFHMNHKVHKQPLVLKTNVTCCGKRDQPLLNAVQNAVNSVFPVDVM